MDKPDNTDPAETAVIKTDLPRRTSGRIDPAAPRVLDPKDLPEPQTDRPRGAYVPGAARVPDPWEYETAERYGRPRIAPPPRRPEPPYNSLDRPVRPESYPPPPPAYVAQATWQMVPVAPSSTVSVWAMVLGIVGVFGGWCLLGLPNLAAIVLGHVGLNDTKDGRKSGRGMAITGLVTGYVMILPAVILFFYMVLGAAATPFVPTPTATP